MKPLEYRSPGTRVGQQQPTSAVIASVAGGLLLLGAIILRVWAPNLLGTARLVPGGLRYFEGQATYEAAVDVSWFLAIAGAILLGAGVYTMLRRAAGL